MAHRRAKTETRSDPKGNPGRPEAVSIRLLGGFEVVVGARTIEEGAWRLRKAASLVKLLALAPNHRLHREQVMDVLWPEHRTSAASNNLRQALHAARRTLEPDPSTASRYLELWDEQLVLCPRGQLWVDADAFEEATRSARRSREPAAYEAALALYAGELLPRDRYEEWAEEHRQRLREAYLSFLLGLARLHEERGEYDLAVEVLGRVLSEEPTREEAHVGLMRLYALMGSEAEALSHYARLEEVLLKELGSEPSASSRTLKEEIEAGRFPTRGLPTSTARPPGSSPEEMPSAPRHNLPASRSSFVGRERELAQIKRELAATRLLTLTGAGGSGKTRLAIEVAYDLVGAYRGGVWLVELAPLSEGALVPQAVAGTLGVSERAGQPLLKTLVEVLRTKEMLLLVDNCEHLVEEAASLVDELLESCASLRVLATSREALCVEGELRWPVPTLSVPDAHRALSMRELESSESVRLFAERARSREPAFALGPENAEAVAEVCRRLDGIPLAIELAAARVGALSVDQILKRLEDSLKLLAGGTRRRSARQRTLRGALDWSHELLSTDEQIVFRRLSVFAGGWTLEAAEAVVGSGDGIESGDILEVLFGLVEKSLVVGAYAAEGGLEGGEVRYRMFEPIRQYASEKLEEGGETEEVRRRHAEYFLALAEEAESELTGPEETRWLERLEPEHDNIRTSLSWSLERKETEPGLRLAGALERFWDARGYYDEGLRWLEAVLAEGARASAGVRAKALYAKGWLAYEQGDIDAAEATAAEGLVRCEEAGLRAGVATSLRIILGRAARDRGDYEEARGFFEEGLALSREAGDRHGVAWARELLASLSLLTGDYERATRLYEENLPLARELGDTQLIGWHLIDLGYGSLLAGDHERATALLEEATALLRARGHKAYLEYALDNLGWAALARGDHQGAKVLHEESLALCKELGDKMIAAESIEGLACAAGARGEAERAARLFGAGQALRGALGAHKTPDEDALREPYLTETRSLLEEEAWEACFAQGQAMTFEQAAEYALSEEESTTMSSQAPDRPPAQEQPPATLTHREQEVARLLARGLTNRRIAEELFLSERTVHRHVSNVLKKLGVSSREQVAAKMAERHPSNTG